jgi:pyridoxine/pyridoxamine 5'-phosphate oxidase
MVYSQFSISSILSTRILTAMSTCQSISVLCCIFYLQFRKWFDDALAAGLKEPNAMGLSTVGKDGKP